MAVTVTNPDFRETLEDGSVVGPVLIHDDLLVPMTDIELYVRNRIATLRKEGHEESYEEALEELCMIQSMLDDFMFKAGLAWLGKHRST